MHKSWQDWSVCAACGGTIHLAWKPPHMLGTSPDFKVPVFCSERVWVHAMDTSPEGTVLDGHEARPARHRADPKPLHWYCDERMDFRRPAHRLPSWGGGLSSWGVGE